MSKWQRPTVRFHDAVLNLAQSLQLCFSSTFSLTIPNFCASLHEISWPSHGSHLAVFGESSRKD